MARYSKKIVKAITDLHSADNYTIKEVCEQVGITTKSYHEWMREKPEFKEAVESAHDARLMFFAKEAKNSLLKKIQGYTVQEKHTTYVDSGKKGENKPKIKEQKVVDKHFQPDTAAIIFTLTNSEPERWKNRRNNEVTGKDGRELIPARVLTKKEAKQLLEDLENDC